MATVIVLGGTGMMGRRVCRLIQRWTPSAHLVAATRRSPRRAGPWDAWVPIDLRDAKALVEACADAAVLVNAVGPYRYDPGVLIDVCAATGCHYLDLSDVPAFTRAARSAYRPAASQDEIASGRAPVMLSGCSTVPALYELMAGALAQRKQPGAPITGLRALLAVGSRNPVSLPLLFTALRPLGCVIDGAATDAGARYFDHMLHWRSTLAGDRWCGRYPATIDDDGIAIGAVRAVPAEFWFGFDRRALTFALRAIAGHVLPAMSDDVLRGMCRLATWAGPPLMELIGTPIGIATLQALDAGGRVVDQVEVMATRNGLDVPAMPAAWAVAMLLERSAGGPTPTTIAELVPLSRAVAWMIDADLRLHGFDGFPEANDRV